MAKDEEWERRRAIDRFLRGESPATIYGSMGRSQHWFYSWLERYRRGDPEWFRERSRRPHNSPRRSSKEIEEIVKGTLVAKDGRIVHPALLQGA